MSKFKRILALVLVFALALSIGVVGISAAGTDTVEVAESAEETGITVYFKSEDAVPYIYYWNALPKNLETDYPGVKMTLDSTQVGGNWYKYTFATSTKINMLFTDGTSELDGQLTPELTRTSGTWWYKDGRFRNYNPDDVIPYDTNDMREETIYFVITTRFYDGDTGNNVHCWDDGQAGNPDSDPAWRGDFKGLADKLDYIKALGFSAIWITPVVTNASGYDYHGYHAMDFSTVDVRYESDNFTYDDLIQAAHDKDMKIIQDVVWQHTGNFGEKFFCPVFEKDLNADLASIEESMIPTEYLLSSYGLSSPAEYYAQKPAVQYQQRLDLM